jgi:hypothetical protein
VVVALSLLLPHVLAWWHDPLRHSQQLLPFLTELQIASVVQPDTAVQVIASHLSLMTTVVLLLPDTSSHRPVAVFAILFLWNVAQTSQSHLQVVPLYAQYCPTHLYPHFSYPLHFRKFGMYAS